MLLIASCSFVFRVVGFIIDDIKKKKKYPGKSGRPPKFEIRARHLGMEQSREVTQYGRNSTVPGKGSRGLARSRYLGKSGDPPNLKFVLASSNLGKSPNMEETQRCLSSEGTCI